MSTYILPILRLFFFNLLNLFHFFSLLELLLCGLVEITRFDLYKLHRVVRRWRRCGTCDARFGHIWSGIRRYYGLWNIWKNRIIFYAYTYLNIFNKIVNKLNWNEIEMLMSNRRICIISLEYFCICFEVIIL